MKKSDSKLKLKLNDLLLAHYAWIVISHNLCNIGKSNSKSSKADNKNFGNYWILNIISMFFEVQILEGF